MLIGERRGGLVMERFDAAAKPETANYLFVKRFHRRVIMCFSYNILRCYFTSIPHVSSVNHARLVTNSKESYKVGYTVIIYIYMLYPLVCGLSEWD